MPTSRTDSKPRSSRTYCLYADARGNPTSFWRNQQGPRVPDVLVSEAGLHPPFPRWVVRAQTVQDAYRYVHRSTLSTATPNGDGVWWSRWDADGAPMPLGRDLTQYWALVAECRAGRTITLWSERWQAERAQEVIDSTGCCGRCWRNHYIIRLTQDEAEKLRPTWWSFGENVYMPFEEPSHTPAA